MLADADAVRNDQLTYLPAVSAYQLTAGLLRLGSITSTGRARCVCMDLIKSSANLTPNLLVAYIAS